MTGIELPLVVLVFIIALELAGLNARLTRIAWALTRIAHEAERAGDVNAWHAVNAAAENRRDEQP